MLFSFVLLAVAPAAALSINGTADGPLRKVPVSFGRDPHLTQLSATATPAILLMPPASEFLSTFTTVIATPDRITATTTFERSKPSPFLKLRQEPEDEKTSEAVAVRDSPPASEPNLFAFCEVQYLFFFFRIVFGPFERGDPYGRLPLIHTKLGKQCGLVTRFAEIFDSQGRPWVKFDLPIPIPSECVEKIIAEVGGPELKCVRKQGNFHH